jgi:hypothetical protein
MGASYLLAWNASSAFDTLLHVGFVILNHLGFIDARVHEDFLRPFVMKCEAGLHVRAVSVITEPFQLCSAL